MPCFFVFVEDHASHISKVIGTVVVSLTIDKHFDLLMFSYFVISSLLL